MDPITDAIRAVIGFFINGIQLTIPLTLAVIAGLFLFNFFQKKYGWKWIGSAFATMVVGFTLILFVIHAVNIFHAYSVTDTSLVPPDVRSNPLYQADQPNSILLLGSALLQAFLSGIIFSLVVLPFAFAGVAVFDSLKPRVKGVWTRIILTCFLASLIFILLLAAFPWILVSLVYLAFLDSKTGFRTIQ